MSSYVNLKKVGGKYLVGGMSYTPSQNVQTLKQAFLSLFTNNPKTRICYSTNISLNN